MKETDVKKKKRIRYITGFAILFCCGFLFLLMNICIGSVKIPPSDVLAIVLGQSPYEIPVVIVMQVRFPRALAALILGGGLALAGYLLQTFFHNPIAGPFVLGISSGAKMVVALAMVFALGYGVTLNSFALIGASFVGAMLSLGFVMLMSKAVDRMSMLIVAGVMIGYICSAITDFIVTFADDANIVNLHNWSLGSFSGITWSNVAVMSIVIFISFIFVFFLSKPMSAYQLGESYARNLGVNIRLFRSLLVILSSILAACVTAFAGPVSFVGIAVPHLMKRMLQTTKPILMIPACFLGGGVFCLFCDLLSRVLFAPTEISVSSITALFGAPIVLVVMIKYKKGEAKGEA